MSCRFSYFLAVSKFMRFLSFMGIPNLTKRSRNATYYTALLLGDEVILNYFLASRGHPFGRSAEYKGMLQSSAELVPVRSRSTRVSD
jgi:hypothetical protein